MSGRLAGRRLYLCTPDRPDLESFVAACVRGGVDVVQLRDKQLDARRQVAQARRLKVVCSDLGVPFVLNDRPDLALDAGADGVHVGQDDASPSLARRLLEPGAIVGLSTHGPDDLARARDEPVDYLSAGPVVATPTKPGRPGTGIGYAGTASSQSAVPVFVTGGVSPASVPDLVAAGVRHFVVVRWLTGADDPEAAARSLRQVIDRSLDRADADPS
ncbi:MAG: thiamine phosphate synthase [Acidimicrobiales bacterium]